MDRLTQDNLLNQCRLYVGDARGAFTHEQQLELARAFLDQSLSLESVRSEARQAALEEAACMAESGQTETVELVPGNFRIERSYPATGKEIAAAIRALAREDVHSTELRK